MGPSLANKNGASDKVADAPRPGGVSVVDNNGPGSGIDGAMAILTFQLRGQSQTRGREVGVVLVKASEEFGEVINDFHSQLNAQVVRKALGQGVLKTGGVTVLLIIDRGCRMGDNMEYFFLLNAVEGVRLGTGGQGQQQDQG
jgi:hypothetical protein